MSNFIKFSLSLLLLFVAGFSFSQTENDITFEKETQKFMKVDEGHRITLVYHFKYNGDIPIKVIPPQVDCSCTEVIIPENNILPSSSDSIVIKFNTTDKIGYQEREVLVHFVSDTMDSRSIEKKLIFKGMVKASKATKEKYKSNH